MTVRHPMLPKSLISPEEARLLVQEIDAGFLASARILSNVRANLLRLHDTYGYIALGYLSWQEFISLHVEASLSTVTRELEAARIEQAAGLDTVDLNYPKKWLKAVEGVPDHLKALTLWVANAVSQGDMNTTWVRATAEVIEEVVATNGMVSVGATQIALEAAIVENAAEAIKRQRQYVFDALNKSDRAIVEWITAKVRITKVNADTYEVFVLSPLDVTRIDYLLKWDGTLDQQLVLKKIKEFIPPEVDDVQKTSADN